MKRAAFLLLIITALCAPLHADDFIQMENGASVKGRVIRITDTRVLFIPDGGAALESLPLVTVSSIKFSDGSRLDFSGGKGPDSGAGAGTGIPAGPAVQESPEAPGAGIPGSPAQNTEKYSMKYTYSDYYPVLGMSLSTEQAFNLTAGFYFGRFGLRTALMIHPGDKTGVQVNALYQIYRNRYFLHDVSIYGGYLNKYWNSNNPAYLGAAYSLNISVFFIETGIAYRFGRSNPLKAGKVLDAPFWIAEVDNFREILSENSFLNRFGFTFNIGVLQRFNTVFGEQKTHISAERIEKQRLLREKKEKEKNAGNKEETPDKAYRAAQLSPFSDVFDPDYPVAGLTFGTPGAVNLLAGYYFSPWGIHASGMYYPGKFAGFQLNVLYKIKEYRSLLFSAGLAFGVYYDYEKWTYTSGYETYETDESGETVYVSYETETLEDKSGFENVYLGPVLNLNFFGVFVELGAGYNFAAEGGMDIGPVGIDNELIAVIFQAGYVHRFN